MSAGAGRVVAVTGAAGFVGRGVVVFVIDRNLLRPTEPRRG